MNEPHLLLIQTVDIYSVRQWNLCAGVTVGVYLYFKSGDTVNVQKVEPQQNGGKSAISTVFNGDSHVNQEYIHDKYWRAVKIVYIKC